MNEERTKTWIATWKKAAIALKKIKKRELQSPDYYHKNTELIDKMLYFSCKNITEIPPSGLIEQQRIFQKQQRHK